MDGLVGGRAMRSRLPGARRDTRGYRAAAQSGSRQPTHRRWVWRPGVTRRGILLLNPLRAEADR